VDFPIENGDFYVSLPEGNLLYIAHDFSEHIRNFENLEGWHDFLWEKKWGSEASKWCDPTRRYPEDEQVDPCCKDHNLQPPDQWLGSGGE